MGYIEDLEVFLGEIYEKGFADGIKKERREWNLTLNVGDRPGLTDEELDTPLDACWKVFAKFKKNIGNSEDQCVPCHKCNGLGFIEKGDFSRLTCGVCGGSGKIY